MPNCKEIIQKYIRDNNYDGLCNIYIECGCSIDDICLMESCFDECVPAYKGKSLDGDDLYYCNKQNAEESVIEYTKLMKEINNEKVS